MKQAQRQLQPIKCSTCDAMLTDFCKDCAAFYRGELSIKPTNPEYMTADERADEINRICRKMTIPLEMAHKRVSELVGRSVINHEIGLNYEGLLEEARTWNHPSFDEVIELIPAEKLIFVHPPQTTIQNDSISDLAKIRSECIKFLRTSPGIPIHVGILLGMLSPLVWPEGLKILNDLLNSNYRFIICFGALLIAVMSSPAIDGKCKSQWYRITVLGLLGYMVGWLVPYALFFQLLEK